MPLITQTSVPDDSPVGVPLIGFNSIINSLNVTTTTSTAGNPASNLANVATHLKWQGDVNTGDEYVTVASGGTPVDYIAFAAHNFNLAGTLLSVETSDTNSPGVWTEIIPPTAIVDASPVIFRFIQIVTQVRVRIQQPVSLLPEAGVAYCGKLLVLERSIKVDVEHTPINFGRKITVVSGMSETGNFLGRIVTGEWRESKADFAWFTPDFYRQKIDPFLIIAKSNPFFWAWSPEEYPLETGFAWLIVDAVPMVNTVTRRVALSLSMRGLA